MTLTIEEARKLLPPEYGQISDEEIQRMIDYMYLICNFAYDWQKNHPWENRADRKKIKPKETIRNQQRHQMNRMPMKGSLDDKIKRHIEHVAHCKCRPIPDKIKQEIQKRLEN